MGVEEQSQDTVEAYLSALEESYGSFPINQTTVSVTSTEYQRERERADVGCVDLYTKIENDQSEILHIKDGTELALPSARTSDETFEYSAVKSVEAATGISCQIEHIEQATILGVHGAEPDEKAVYRLAVIFVGTPESETPAAEAVWHTTAKIPDVVAP
ncbi:hypothetical protein ACFQJ7_02865 [Halovenus rubra]|uniref:Uncharacterized protein n=2 Tax=Halovenus rubra TaxID=869890 RepID=A0ABD5X9A3_9EURY|nr:hypothetical protein [Halovenus rubra]